ncbi:leucine-rich repeat domain-containing protein, partial [Mycoplasma elephantis]|uniref:leucine-rich repeat domain-containing protein n=1 Tax=Mycoplasma elephantis TaxID=114882 RepID=UPI0005698895
KNGNNATVSYEISKGNKKISKTKEFVGFATNVDWSKAQEDVLLKSGLVPANISINDLSIEHFELKIQNNEFSGKLLNVVKDKDNVYISYELQKGKVTTKKEKTLKNEFKIDDEINWDDESQNVTFKHKDGIEISNMLFDDVSEDPDDYLIEYYTPNEFKAHIYKIVKNNADNSVKILYYLSKNNTSKTSGMFETPIFKLTFLSSEIEWSKYKVKLTSWSPLDLILPSELQPFMLRLEVFDEQNKPSNIQGTIIKTIPDDENGILGYKYYLSTYDNKTNKEIRSKSFEAKQDGMAKKENKDLIEIFKKLRVQAKDTVSYKKAGINAQPEDLEYKYDGGTLDPSIKITILEVKGEEKSDQVSALVKLEYKGKTLTHTFQGIYGFMTLENYEDREITYTDNEGNEFLTQYKGVLQKVTLKNPNATTLKLPNEVKSISEKAFKDIESLTEIDLNNAKEITYNAFINKTNLKKVIGNNIKEIGENAFSGCKNLETFEISSEQLKTVNADAFNDTKIITKFDADGYCMLGNVLLRLSDKVINDSIGIDFVLNSKVKYAAGDVFNKLKCKTFDGNKLEYMAWNNFVGNYANEITIEKIVLPNLTEVQLRNSFDNYGKKSYFVECKNLKEVNLGKLKILSEYMLHDCESLEIIIGNEVTELTYHSLLENLPNLVQVNFPKVKDPTKGNNPKISGSTKLPYDADGFYVWNGALLDYKGTKTEIKLPDSVKIVSYEVLKNKNLISVDLNMAQEIESGSLSQNPELKIIIGKNLIKIGNYVFDGNMKIEKFDYNDSKIEWQQSKESSFKGSNLYK